MKAFNDERRRVNEDAKTGNKIPRGGGSGDWDMTCCETIPFERYGHGNTNSRGWSGD